MEEDIKLKHLLTKDNKILKTEVKLLLEYLKCKGNVCLDEEKGKFKQREFEECLLECSRGYQAFMKFKEVLYSEFSGTYYEAFLKCSSIEGDNDYKSCISNLKESMGKDTKKILDLLYTY